MDAENRDELAKLPGASFAFEAVDAGDDAAVLDALRKNCAAPQTLSLKLGAQVVLIKNVDDALVNGSRGVVRGFVTRGDTEFARHKSSFRIHPRRSADAERVVSADGRWWRLTTGAFWRWARASSARARGRRRTRTGCRCR